MKKTTEIFFRILIILIGIGTLALLLWEPHVEGRNAHATFFEVYAHDPFLAYVYIASTSFFTILYQAFKALGYVGQNNTYLQPALRALRIIKYCAITLVAFVLGAQAYLFIAMRGKDDIAGGMAMGFL